MPGVINRMIRPGQQREIEVDVPGGGREVKTFLYQGEGRRPYPLKDISGIPVTVQGDGVRIILRAVPARHRIEAGDILTSAGDARLRFGVFIGKVEKTERDRKAPQFVTVFVKPLAKLHLLRDVYVVVPSGREGN